MHWFTSKGNTIHILISYQLVDVVRRQDDLISVGRIGTNKESQGFNYLAVFGIFYVSNDLWEQGEENKEQSAIN